MTDKYDPYVGPRPFSRGDEARFFGRRQEANDLLSLIIAHQVVLLYAQSGAGKTSLLNARVVPMLEAKKSRVLGPVRVGGSLPQWITYRDIENIYCFNALLSIKGELLDSQSSWNISFTDLLKSQTFATQSEQYVRRVVIFDQFEEMFSTHPERWKDRRFFFDGVGDALEDDPNLRVVFVIREEFVASMDPFAPILPEKLRTRFRLERLREEAALLAVTKPLEDTGYTFAPGAAERLVGDLLQVPIKSATGTMEVLGEFVEPVQLQVVCKKMWQSLPSNIKVIDESYIEHYGDANKALASYYDECIKRAAERSNIREGVLRRWFGQKLITPDRTRGTVYKDTYTSSGITNDAIAILEDLHLVRPEMRGGALWYELTHDRFIVSILQSNDDWFDKMEGGRSIGQRLEERAKAWFYGDRFQQTSYLLKEGELQEAAEWLESANAEDFGVTETLRQFIQASQSEVTKSLRKQRNILILVTIIAIAAFGVAVTSSISSLIHQRSDNEKSIMNGLVAKYLSDIPGNEFYSLQLAIVASDVGGNDIPQEAVDGLRAAVTAVGDSMWLRGMTPDARFTNVAFLSNGDYALAFGPSEICIWRTDRGKLLFKTPPKERNDEYAAAKLTPDGKRLVTISVPKTGNNEKSQGDEQRKYTIEIWDVSSANNMPLIKSINSLAVFLLDDDSYVGRYVLIVNADASFVIDVESVNAEAANGMFDVNISAQEARKILAAVIVPKQMHLILIEVQGDLKVWDLKTKKAIKTLLRAEKGSFIFTALHLSTDDRLVFMADYGPPTRYEYKVYIWDLDGYQLVKYIPFGLNDYKDSYLSNDGKKFIVITGKDSDPIGVSIWDVKTGGKQQSISRQSMIRSDDSYGSDRSGMLIFDRDEKPALMFEDYDTGNRSLLIESISKYGDLNAADVSPNGRVLALINGVTIYIRKSGSSMLNVNNASPEQLKRIGCGQLRAQPDPAQTELDILKTRCSY